jgi:magnesium transporter
MIRSFYLSKDSQVKTGLDVSEYAPALQDMEGLLWVDFQGTPPQDDEPIFRDVFKFHPLAIDDALQESHVPKVDDWETYLYIVIHAISYNSQADEEIETQELDIFLGKNFVVTHHDKPIDALDRVADVLPRDVRMLRNGSDHLVYRLMDEIVSSYMPVVESLDDAIDLIEDEVFNHPREDMVEDIFRLKRAVLHLRRIIGPQREALNKLARDDYHVIDSHDRVYFRDVYDHLVRLYDIAESLRDLVSGTLDTYLSVVNNRMNDIMKTLTGITTLFMPISFVAGFYGMNFFSPVLDSSRWTGKYMFITMLVTMIVLPIVMYLYVRHKKWM